MAQAQQGDTVKVNYTGRLGDGTVFDTSVGREPLEFTIGEGEVIPGFEEAVVGMEPGQTKTITIPPDEAYGPRDDEMVIKVDRSEFPPDMDPQVGDALQMVQPDGQAFLVRVTDATETTVTLDANHPLAGETLIFELELVEIVPRIIAAR